MAQEQPRIKSRPEDFLVEEVLRTQPGASGDYAVYRATKRLLTTLELQERLAQILGIPPRAIVIPALKDKGAVAIQHLTIRGRAASRITGEGFVADFVGRMPRHLAPGDLAGNRFTVRLHEIAAGFATGLAQRVADMERTGFPNYFDEQRFGSYTPGGTFIGKAILQGDAETALKAYLAEPASGDPPPLRAFKRFAGEHWRDWPAMLREAPRSNQRSVITFLKDHPGDFRKALNLITPRLLPILLAAYQSFLWNKIASRFLSERLAGSGARTTSIKIAGESLVLYEAMPDALLAELGSVAVPLPEHRVELGTQGVAAAAREVLAQEGLAPEQLKARLLKRAYLPRGRRPLVARPREAAARLDPTETGERRGVELSFFLPPGSYATLVLKTLAATTPTRSPE